MTEAVVEKLVQKVVNMIDEVADLNLQVRKLPGAQETQNRIHERLDAVHGALKLIEEGISLEVQKLDQLEVQMKTLEEGICAVRQAEERIAGSITNVATKIEGLGGRIRELESNVAADGERRSQVSTSMAYHFGIVRRRQWTIGILTAVVILIVVLYK